MSIGTLVTISCILTSVTMVIFSGFLFIVIQSGSRGVRGMFNRLLGRGGDDDDDDEKKKESDESVRTRPRISSGDALRQRAQQLTFAPQAGAQGFNAQGAPQQASFSSRDPLSAPPQNQQYGQPQQAQFGKVNPSMPSLSSARPFQSGQQPLGGQSQYGQPQQPLGGQSQYGQQPLGGQPQQPLGGQSQYGQQPLGGQPQQPLGGQSQYGQQPLGGQPQQPLGGQPQAQNPLGNYAPPLSGGVNFDQNTAPGLRRQRDSRKGDDRDTIYDDSDGGGGILGEVGDFLG